MKKLMMAGICGFMLMATCTLTNTTKVEPKVAGSGLTIIVRI